MGTSVAKKMVLQNKKTSKKKDVTVPKVEQSSTVKKPITSLKKSRGMCQVDLSFLLSTCTFPS